MAAYFYMGGKTCKIKNREPKLHGLTVLNVTKLDCSRNRS
mgnify:CR=1